jgi:hypothetical protein
LGDVEDWSSRAGGDGGRLAVAVVHAREREREEEEAGADFKYELVVSI